MPTIFTQLSTFVTLTEFAHRSLQVAQAFARLHNHEFIGTDSFLVACLDIKDCVAHDVLRAQGVKKERLIEYLSTIVEDGKVTAPVDERFKLAPGFQACMLNAQRLASHAVITTGSILKAIVQDQTCVGFAALAVVLNWQQSKKFDEIAIEEFLGQIQEEMGRNYED